ncbi:sulfite exporter TauE/SafE family protein [Candidatus Peregrinibacteria bacterium]|nr:MAG: sulfite exporter TauE/SafE family protein [Candidatus Peregrinibacteria bacterium]
MEPLHTVILFVGGILSGLYGSTVGSGGLVSFPLVLLTGLPIHSAIATNRFGATLLELSSTARFYKEKKLNFKLGLVFGLVAAFGSFIGSNIVFNIDEKYLNLIIAIALLSVFLVLIFKNKLGLQEKNISRKHWIAALFGSLLLGIYGGFFGIGFGTFITFIFLLIGLNFIKSAAVSRVVGLVMSLTATAVFAYHDAINYPYAIALGLGLAIGGWIGVGIGVKKGNEYIRILFLVILLTTIGKLIFEFFK